MSRVSCLPPSKTAGIVQYYPCMVLLSPRTMSEIPLWCTAGPVQTANDLERDGTAQIRMGPCTCSLKTAEAERGTDSVSGLFVMSDDS